MIHDTAFGTRSASACARSCVRVDQRAGRAPSARSPAASSRPRRCRRSAPRRDACSTGPATRPHMPSLTRCRRAGAAPSPSVLREIGAVARPAVDRRPHDLEPRTVTAPGDGSGRRRPAATTAAPASLGRSTATRRVRSTIIGRSSTRVVAPGYGGATARTRLWIAAAPCRQSMRPSSALRPPKYEPRARSFGDAERMAVDQVGQRAPQRLFRRDHDLAEDLVGRVVGQDRHRGLRDDRAGIGLGRHLVQRRAGLRFAVDDRPVDRHAAAVLRQQRAVHVVGAARRERQDRGRQHVAEVEREQEIGRRRPRPAALQRGRVEVFRVHTSGCRVRRAVSCTLANQIVSCGLSRWVTTSATSTPRASSVSRQRTPTS